MEESSNAPPYFASPPAKIVLFSVATAGLFQFLWCYRCWRHVGNRLGRSLHPVSQVVFYPWSLLFYFVRLRGVSGRPSIPAIVLIIFFWLLSALASLHPRWGSLAFVCSALPLVATQFWAAASNTAVGARPLSDTWRPTRAELVFLLLLAPFAALAYAAAIWPGLLVEGAG